MSKRSEALYRKAESLYGRKGQAQEAIQAYKAYLKEVPDNATAWSELGALYTACDDISSAFICYQRAIEFVPDEPEFWMQKALILNDMDRSQNAAFTQLQPLKNEYQKHFVDLAALRAELVQSYEKVIEAGDNVAAFELKRAMNGKARVLSELGRHREALEAYAELVQLEKSPRRKSRQLFAMALQYEALGEWYQALDTIDECLNDGEIILLTHKARILQKAGRETDAQKTYHQFLQAVDEKIIQTQDPAYYFQKATVLEKLGRTDQAIASLRDLLKFGKNLTPQRKAEAQDRLRTLERTK